MVSTGVLVSIGMREAFGGSWPAQLATGAVGLLMGAGWGMLICRSLLKAVGVEKKRRGKEVD